MPQKAKGGRPILGEHHGTYHPLGKQDRQHRLQYIDQNNPKGPSSAEGTEKVGQPGIAAAMGPHIVVKDILGDNDRSIGAAQQVSHHRRQQKHQK